MGKPLRVLHVVVNMNRGGAETLIMNLYRNIDRAKIQFDFLTCKEGVFDSEIEEMGGKIYRIPYITEAGHFKYMKELKDFFQTHNDYKIVHAHMDKMSGFVLRAAKRAGIPVRISHSHNTESEGGPAAKMYKWYAGKLILPNATDYFACSKSAAEWLYEEKTQNTTILRNGIEDKEFIFSSEIRKQVRAEFNLRKDLLVVGHVGRFAHQKNHNFLIEIFYKVQRIHENSVLILVGDGPLRKDIKQKVKELGMEDKVVFTGIRNDISRLLQAFDVFAFPSLHEGLPVSLIEAQCSGLSCLISDNISKEVDLNLNLIHYLSLYEKEKWVEKILNIHKTNSPRTINKEWIATKGYAIRNTANELTSYYLSVSR